MVLFAQATIVEPGPDQRRRQPFTPAEERAIVWAYQRGWTLAKIGDRCGRHWTVVQQRIGRLIAQGVLARREPLPGQRPWTAAELRDLQTHWGLESDAAIAARLGRTPAALKIKATRVLHQARGDAFLSASEVARLLGVNEKTVVRWARVGLIELDRAATSSGGPRLWAALDRPRRQWSVSPASLRRFFHDQPWLIPPVERMPHPEHWLAGAARAAWDTDPWLTIEQVAARLHLVPAIVRAWIVKEQVVPHQRRPKYGGRAGPWQGRVVIRASDVPRLVERREAVVFWRSHDAAVQRWARERQRHQGASDARAA